jgi:hypothetical protein
MALARVVTFDGVASESIEAVRAQIEGDPPEGLPAKEIIVLHDADAAKSLVIAFFDDDEDYATGDATLNAMPTGDTPGERTSVAKYEVAVRRTL